MSNQHTPGPWIARGENNDQLFLGGELDGNWPFFIRQDKEFKMGETPYHIAYGIQDAADARLIAAAPEMLAALQELLSDKYLSDPINADRTASARAAVDKATTAMSNQHTPVNHPSGLTFGQFLFLLVLVGLLLKLLCR